MAESLSTPLLDRIGRAADATQGLALLMLFGSRARADAHPRSDWDFGYVAAPGADTAALLSSLVEITGSDRVDLVDLRRAGGLLRYRAARDGRTLYEAKPGAADVFRLEAIRFWSDMMPVLQRGYEDVLAGLDR